MPSACVGVPEVAEVESIAHGDVLWLILDSRVVTGQDWCSIGFLQVFPWGHGRGGILGKSGFISRVEVLYEVCKTPESNMSQPLKAGDTATIAIDGLGEAHVNVL